MRFIDKEQLKEESTALMIRFLQDCFDEGTGKFIPPVDSDSIYTNAFCNKIYRKGDRINPGWEPILIRQQENRCCYCMRRLLPRNPDIAAKLNFEHIVPRNMEGDGRAEFAKYAAISDVIAGNVEYNGVFAAIRLNSKDELAGVTKFPHKIALANLMASCNGKRGSMAVENVRRQAQKRAKDPHAPADNPGCCCNNARHTDFFEPIMLHSERAACVFYDGRSGAMSIIGHKWTAEAKKTWDKIVEILNDETYKEIRHLWYLISLHFPDFDSDRGMQLGMPERIDLMKQIFEVDDFTNIEERYQKYTGFRINNDFYWNLLMDYDWFLQYDWDRRPAKASKYLEFE